MGVSIGMIQFLSSRSPSVQLHTHAHARTHTSVASDLEGGMYQRGTEEECSALPAGIIKVLQVDNGRSPSWETIKKGRAVFPGWRGVTASKVLLPDSKWQIIETGSCRLTV